MQRKSRSRRPRLTANGRPMIVDVHSHAWEYPAHFSDDFRQQARRAKAGVEMDLTVTYDDYRRHAPDDTITVVFG